MIKVIVLLILSFSPPLVFGQVKEKNMPVAWLTTEEAGILLEKETRPVLVDVFTEWCRYCKVMDATTWADPQVADYLAKYFYPVKFNAEQTAPALWMGKSYEYKASYKVHMLAAEWLQGNMVYPSMVILPPKGGEPIVIPGVITVKELEPVLNYFGGKHYLTTSWKAYKSSYRNKWK